MFNERSEIWIKILKNVVIVSFCLLAFAAVVFGVSDMTCGVIDVDIIGDDGLGDFLIWIIILGIPALFDLSVGMLMVNFFTNIQDIRKKICEDN